MNIDVLSLKILVDELNSLIANQRIDKIYQINDTDLLINIRINNKQSQLFISTNSNLPRINLTNKKYDTLLKATNFCMLLRKHIQGGKITNLEIFNNDRIIKIVIKSKNEMMDVTNFYLYVELMGRYSNVVLVNDKNIVIDAIKRIGFEDSDIRYIFPGVEYSYQPMTKKSILDSDFINNYFENNKTIDEIKENITGINKYALNLIVNSKNQLKTINDYINCFNSDIYYPCIQYDKNDKPINYSYVDDINYKCIKYDSFNEAIDEFYNIQSNLESIKNLKTKTSTLLNKLEKRNTRRILDSETKIKESSNYIEYKNNGDLILTYSYLIKPRDEYLECFDYYTEQQTKIKLDINLSPSKNAEKFFNTYQKKKRTLEKNKELLTQELDENNYYNSVKNLLSLDNDYDSILEIYEELQKLDCHTQNNKSKKQEEIKSKPLHITEEDVDIYVGKNSIQNDYVSFKIGDKEDMWFHVKSGHGSHVIAKGNINEQIILKCAQFAAKYSSEFNSNKVEVVYCLRKNVKKIPNSKFGNVIYTNYKTIVVSPLDI
ncbi:MAG: NFACT family protein [Clostridia bacterium]|nr:NFACT family protein [Clostridia bacterium]